MNNIFSKKWYFYLVSGLISLTIYLLVIHPVYELVKYRHKVVFDDYRRFMWLFNDTVSFYIPSKNGDTNMAATGLVRESDQYFLYNLIGMKHVHIFEFRDLNLVKLDNIKFNFSDDYKKFRKNRCTLYHSDVKNATVIGIKYELPFYHELMVNFDPFADLKEIKKSKNVIAYFGDADYMSLGNIFGKQLVFFDFTRKDKIIIVFYKLKSKFYIILIDSERELKVEDLNILNLTG